MQDAEPPRGVPAPAGRGAGCTHKENCPTPPPHCLWEEGGGSRTQPASSPDPSNTISGSPGSPGGTQPCHPRVTVLSEHTAQQEPHSQGLSPAPPSLPVPCAVLVSSLGAASEPGCSQQSREGWPGSHAPGPTGSLGLTLLQGLPTCPPSSPHLWEQPHRGAPSPSVLWLQSQSFQGAMEQSQALSSTCVPPGLCWLLEQGQAPVPSGQLWR